MPFGGEYVMIWKESHGYQIFFVLLYLSNTATTLMAQELRFKLC